MRELNLTKDQTRLFQEDSREIVIAGYNGGGKTYSLVASAIYRALEIPNTTVLFTSTLPEYTFFRNIIHCFEYMLENLGAKYKVNRHSGFIDIYLKNGMPSTIKFQSTCTPGTVPYKNAGLTYSMILFDNMNDLREEDYLWFYCHAVTRNPEVKIIGSYNREVHSNQNWLKYRFKGIDTVHYGRHSYNSSGKYYSRSIIGFRDYLTSIRKFHAKHGAIDIK